MLKILLAVLLALATCQESSARGYGGYDPDRPRASIDSASDIKLSKRMASLGYDKWIKLNGIYKPKWSHKGIKAEINVSVRTAEGETFAYDSNESAYFAKIILMASRILGLDISEIELVNTTTSCKRQFYMMSFMEGGCSGHLEPALTLTGLVNDAHGVLPKGAGLAKAKAAAEAFFRKLWVETKVRAYGDGWFTIEADGMHDAVVKGAGLSESVVLYVFRSIHGATGGSDGYSDFAYDDDYTIVADGAFYPREGDRQGGPSPFEPEHFKDLDAFVNRFNAAMQAGMAGPR